MSKKKNKQGGFVYSTNPDFQPEEVENEHESTVQPGKQDLRVHLEKKHRAGKTVTIVSGFQGTDDYLKELGRFLRNRCGSGGSVSEGEILIQGDHREKVLKLLQESGYRAKRGGG